jgi:predicted signal transduction protein with EAL and GGDEF domain
MSTFVELATVWLAFGVIVSLTSVVSINVHHWWERRKLRQLFANVERDQKLTHRGKFEVEQNILHEFAGWPNMPRD